MENFDHKVMWKEEKPFADRLSQWTKTTLNPTKVVDLGCGPGMYVVSLREISVNAYGYDLDARILNKESLGLRHANMFEVNDPADVVFCIEVAEHIAADHEIDVVKAVTRNTLPGGTLIWSAAHPEQGGIGHINCRPKDHWHTLLESCGMRRDHDRESQLLHYIRSGYHMGWFSMNAMVFVRGITV